jgi:hypothetical protein
MKKGRFVIPMIGNKYGKLTVLHRVKDRFIAGAAIPKYEIWYRVLCDCGRKRSLRGYMLRQGKVRACNVCRPKGFKHGLFGTKEYQMWDSVKGRADRAGIKFTLRVTDIYVPEFCPLLGIRIKKNNKITSPNSPSMDRRNPKKGYTKENTWIISHRANTIKNNASLQELKTIASNWERLWPSYT